MGGTQGWLSTLWSLSVIDKDGEDVRKLREQRLGDRVIKRVNKCIANAFLGFLAQCAMEGSSWLGHFATDYHSVLSLFCLTDGSLTQVLF